VPWSVAFLPDGDWLVSERTGSIRLFRAGKLLDQPVAKVDIAAGDEGGLLGIAADPAFASTRHLFVYATVRDGDRTVNRVLRYQVSGDGLTATMDRVLIDGIPAHRFHDGGRLRFGPDGMLYVGTGDARNPDSAQDPKSLSGKILRVTKDGAPAPGNPSPGNPAFISGLRNTEGFDWLDPSTLLITDHGPSGELQGRTGHDEVSLARAGDNLGWPPIYGCEARQGMVSPLLTWKKAVPPGGAALYTGDAIPAWKGSLLIGVLGARHLHRVALSADRSRVDSHETYLLGDPPAGYGRLRDVIMAPDGTVFVTTSNCDGRGTCPPDKDKVLRIKSAAPD